LVSHGHGGKEGLELLPQVQGRGPGHWAFVLGRRVHVIAGLLDHKNCNAGIGGFAYTLSVGVGAGNSNQNGRMPSHVNPEQAFAELRLHGGVVLQMRMGMRRFTRLTNGFSKKLENLRHAVAIHYMHYNFCRVHKSLRVTPAMEAGLADHVWALEELVKLLDSKLSVAA